MKYWEFHDRPQLTPPKPVQGCQDARPKPGWELDRLEFAFPIGPHTNSKLLRADIIPAS